IKEYVGAINFEKFMPAEFEKFYPEERVRRKISIKTIATKLSESEKWAKTSQKYLRELKLVNNPLPFSSNMQIYKNGVGLISYKDSFIGVIVESKDISNMFQSAFELMWGATA
ncbi:MAG: hypothetical protein AAB348_03590, partial [Patescibacteria group bacterium]